MENVAVYVLYGIMILVLMGLGGAITMALNGKNKFFQSKAKKMKYRFVRFGDKLAATLEQEGAADLVEAVADKRRKGNLCLAALTGRVVLDAFKERLIDSGFTIKLVKNNADPAVDPAESTQVLMLTRGKSVAWLHYNVAFHGPDQYHDSAVVKTSDYAIMIDTDGNVISETPKEVKDLNVVVLIGSEIKLVTGTADTEIKAELISSAITQSTPVEKDASQVEANSAASKEQPVPVAAPVTAASAGGTGGLSREEVSKIVAEEVGSKLDGFLDRLDKRIDKS